MSIGPRRPRSRSVSLALAGSLGLAIAVLALTQCRRVDDRVLGVGPQLPPSQLGAKRHCLVACAEEYKHALRREIVRHRAALERCRRNVSCKQHELGVHRANLGVLAMNRKRCKRACYLEGAGAGGR